MNRRRTQIIATLATILVVGGFVLVPHIASAQLAEGISMINSAAPTVVSAVASAFSIAPWISAAIEFLFNNILLPLANMFVQLTGFLLNATMTITLNMNQLVSSTGGIVDSTWSIIRDISSILIIFFLLYTAIEIIIGVVDSKVQHIIVMVALAGILINFSLFFTKIAVDASNLVSLAFYRAITPTGSAQLSSTPGAYLGSAVNDGGLSNVFMNALQLQTFYNPASGVGSISTSTTTPLTGPDPIVVMAAGAGGVAVMFIAGLSFLAAAILFTVRIGFLILLMAFSPVFFLGMIIPKFKDKISDRWKDALVGQCMIMPVYMLFMYVAMRVITNPNFKNFLNPTAQTANSSLGLGGLPALMVTPSTIGIVIQYIIAIMLIMIPLFAAMTYASFGKEWANDAVKKVKGWGKSALAGAGRNTIGQGAYKLQNKIAQSSFAANNPNAALLFNKASGAVAGAGFGGTKGGFTAAEKKRLGSQDKSRKDLYERMGKVNREDYATEEEYNAARRVALGRQGQLVGNLRSNTILSHLTGARNIGVAKNPFNVPGGANLRSATNLEKSQKKAEAKEYEKDNKKEKEENDLAIREYRNALNKPGISDKQKADLQEQISTLEGYNKKLQKQIEEAGKARKEDDKSAQAKATAKALKEEQEQGGSEKPEKKESGGDKQKT